jgi:hypothetical protein
MGLFMAINLVTARGLRGAEYWRNDGVFEAAKIIRLPDPARANHAAGSVFLGYVVLVLFARRKPSEVMAMPNAL